MVERTHGITAPLSPPSLPEKSRIDGPSLYDVTPTILAQLGLRLPEDL